MRTLATSTPEEQKQIAIQKINEYRKEALSFDKAYAKRKAAVDTAMETERIAALRHGFIGNQIYTNFKVIVFTTAENQVLNECHNTIRKANRLMESKKYGKQTVTYYTNLLNSLK